MEHPKLNKLKLAKTTWKMKNNQWIKTMVYNIRKGGDGMSLTKDDKEWIKDAIVTGLDGSLKPVIIEMREGFKTINDRITNLVEKNDLKE